MQDRADRREYEKAAAKAAGKKFRDVWLGAHGCYFGPEPKVRTLHVRSKRYRANGERECARRRAQLAA